MPQLEDILPRVEMPLGVDSNDDFSGFAGAFHLETGYGLALLGGILATSHHLSVSMPDTEPSSRLHAVVRGRIRFVPPATPAPARIELQPLPFELYTLGARLGGSILPSLFLYGNVDPAAVDVSVGTLLQAMGLTEVDRTAQRSEFLAGTRWMTVEAGAVIGKPAVDSTLGGRRRLDLAVQDQQGFFLNPAHFLFAWPELREALEDHPLLQALVAQQHTHMFPMKSQMLLVRHDSPSPAPPYATADTAAHMVNDAMGEAASGDIVCVVDNAVYDEKVFMSDGVTLTSSAILGTTGRPAEADANLPTLSDPGGESAAVVFEDLVVPAHISGFKISGGGTGVSVINCVNVEIAQCDIFLNETIHGGGVGIFDSRRVVVAHCRIRNNVVEDDGGKGQGGGVYVGGESADVTIEQNYIYRNRATNFGGGVCIDNPARYVILRRNRIGGTTDADGNQVTLDRLPYEDSVLLDNPQGGGGGIGVYETNVTLIGNEIWHNEAHSGGGVEFYGFAYGRLVGNDIANNRTREENATGAFPVGGDGGGIAVNNTALTKAVADQHCVVVLINNRIRNNVAEDDGGGIYGTAKALLDISGNDTEISGNRARNNGGGIRISFGSQIRVRDGVISGNNANVGGGKGGGGGIAARNSRLELEDCLIEDNQVNDFGGGGVYMVTLKEGGIQIPGVPNFDDLLTDSYGFGRAELRLNQVTIIENTASGDKGAGAGLYVVYNEYDVHVKVDDTTLSENHASHSNVLLRKNVVFQYSEAILPARIDDNLPSLSPLTGYDETFSPP